MASLWAMTASPRKTFWGKGYFESRSMWVFFRIVEVSALLPLETCRMLLGKDWLPVQVHFSFEDIQWLPSLPLMLGLHLYQPGASLSLVQSNKNQHFLAFLLPLWKKEKVGNDQHVSSLYPRQRERSTDVMEEGL